MTNSSIWGALIIAWVVAMAPPYFYLGHKANTEDCEGPAESKFNRVMLIWIIGFFGVLALWGVDQEAPGFGIVWSVVYLAAIFAWEWRKRRLKRPDNPPARSRPRVHSRQTAIRIIFAGAAGFIVCSLMGKEISGFIYELEGRPLWGGFHQIFNGPIPQVTCALVTLFGGYLLFSQRTESN